MLPGLNHLWRTSGCWATFREFVLISLNELFKIFYLMCVLLAFIKRKISPPMKQQVSHFNNLFPTVISFLAILFAVQSHWLKYKKSVCSSFYFLFYFILCFSCGKVIQLLPNRSRILVWNQMLGAVKEQITLIKRSYWIWSVLWLKGLPVIPQKPPRFTQTEYYDPRPEFRSSSAFLIQTVSNWFRLRFKAN